VISCSALFDCHARSWQAHSFKHTFLLGSSNPSLAIDTCSGHGYLFWLFLFRFSLLSKFLQACSVRWHAPLFMNTLEPFLTPATSVTLLKSIHTSYLFRFSLLSKIRQARSFGSLEGRRLLVHTRLMAFVVFAQSTPSPGMCILCALELNLLSLP
jgi:hypothetical protein